MSKMLNQCLSFYERHNLRHKDIVIAYSGGIDSQVLLHLFATLLHKGTISSRLVAVHINHGLSQFASEWALFAKLACDNLAIEFKELIVKVEGKGGIEAAARQARYNAIAEFTQPNSVVLTGHHLDDQAETLFLALKRGAGVQGLSSMPELSDYPQNDFGKQLVIARPLLNFSRIEIEDYAKTFSLDWIEDDSNIDIRFDRNFLRHNILLKLKKRWPSILNTVARSAENCQESASLLQEVAIEDLNRVRLSNESLSIVSLLALSTPRVNNVLRYFLSGFVDEAPSKAVLAQIKNILTAKEDKLPQVQIGKFWLRRHRDSLKLTKTYEDLSNVSIDVEIKDRPLKVCLPDGLSPLTFAYGTQLEGAIKAPAEEKVYIRFSHTNPKVEPHFRSKSRSLKKVLQELDIPWWERKRIPFIYYDETLVAAVGYFIDKRYLAKIGEESLKIDR